MLCGVRGDSVVVTGKMVSNGHEEGIEEVDLG